MSAPAATPRPTATHAPVITVRPAPRTSRTDAELLAAGRILPGPWGIEVPLPFESDPIAAAAWEAAVDAARRARRAPGRTGRTDRAPVRGHPTLAPDEVARIAAWFARLVVEVCEGRRPLAQLHGHQHLVLQEVDMLRRTSVASGRRPALRRVTACEPVEGVLEVAAVLSVAARTRAVAFRLERQPAGPWSCTAFRAV